MVIVGNAFLLPGATVATILMLGALHGRRLYEDKKVLRQLVLVLSLDFFLALVLFWLMNRLKRNGKRESNLSSTKMLKYKPFSFVSLFRLF